VCKNNEHADRIEVDVSLAPLNLRRDRLGMKGVIHTELVNHRLDVNALKID